MFTAVKNWWSGFREKHPELAKFAMFFIFSNGVTLLQIAMMPLFRWFFDNYTNLAQVGFQILPVGQNLDGSQYYMFDYPAGSVEGGGGGLAYFLAVQITLLIAQVINFFLQRNITFRSNSSVWIAAMWYFIAYVVITFVAAAAQGFYRVPIYDFLIGLWGPTGAVIADFITVIINAAISFWVFYPIFRVIFRQKPEETVPEAAEQAE